MLYVNYISRVGEKKDSAQTLFTQHVLLNMYWAHTMFQSPLLKLSLTLGSVSYCLPASPLVIDPTLLWLLSYFSGLTLPQTVSSLSRGPLSYPSLYPQHTIWCWLYDWCLISGCSTQSMDKWVSQKCVHWFSMSFGDLDVKSCSEREAAKLGGKSKNSLWGDMS